MATEVTIDYPTSKMVTDAVAKVGTENVGWIARETGLTEIIVMGALILRAQKEHRGEA